MKKVVFAFILLLALMAAVVVMWGQINKVLMDLHGGGRSSHAATTGSSSRTA